MSELNKVESKTAKVRRKFGAYLKREREARHFTQKFVADFLGFRTPQLISNWERGIAAPPFKEVRKLARLYSVNQDELTTIFSEYQQAISDDAMDLIKQKFTEKSPLLINPKHLDS